MKLRKMMTSLTLLLLLAPLAFAIPKKIAAAELTQEVTFVLHKRVFYTLGVDESVRLRPNVDVK